MTTETTTAYLRHLGLSQCAMAIAAAADASDAGDLTTIPARFDGGAGVIRVGDRRCYVEG